MKNIKIKLLTIMFLFNFKACKSNFFVFFAASKCAKSREIFDKTILSNLASDNNIDKFPEIEQPKKTEVSEAENSKFNKNNLLKSIKIETLKSKPQTKDIKQESALDDLDDDFETFKNSPKIDNDSIDEDLSEYSKREKQIKKMSIILEHEKFDFKIKLLKIISEELKFKEENQIDDETREKLEEKFNEIISFLKSKIIYR